MRKILLILVGTLAYMSLYAQFTTGTTGLLNMPTAEMQRDKTFMFGGGFWKNMPHQHDGHIILGITISISIFSHGWR